MIKGFTTGRFCPFHLGHMALIEYAKSNCDHLTILVAAKEGEPIPLKYRLSWVTQTYLHDPNIEVIGDTINHPEDLSYDDLSKWWGYYIFNRFGSFSRVFSSEEYGEEFAKTMNAENWVFNKARTIVPISATMIRDKPFTYWDYLNNYAKDYFVKKIAILGTESTGKTIMCERLAKHYETDWCPELGRKLVPNSRECAFDDLILVAVEHAKHILKHTRTANKVLFVDTDLTITRSYSKYLFKRELQVPFWVEDVNVMDDYIFLYHDAPYVNDGTRLNENDRKTLAGIHMKGFKEAGIKLNLFNYPKDFEVDMSYDFRFDQVVKHIDKFLKQF